MEFNMTDKMSPPQTYSTLPCSRQSRTLLNPFGLAYSSRPVLPCYAHGRLNKVNSTPRSTQRGEGSVSLLASQTRQPHHTSDSGPASTSAETRPAKEMVGTLRSHSNNAVTRTPQKPPQAPVLPNFEEMWSEEGHLRQLPGLRVLATAFTGVEGIIPLHGGLPPASAFPLSGIQLTLKDGTKIDITDPQEMVHAQQYGLTMKGYPPLLKWVTEHTHQLHNPSPEVDIIITGGSNYSIEMLMRLFMDKGDPILCEEYTYPHVPESLVIPMGFKSVGIRIDHHGIIPGHLLETLEKLQSSGQKMPKLLYTIPIGQNPTGATQTAERKREIYAICRRFGILIIEDDPYFYLQYKAGEAPRGFNNLGESYLSMDTDSRVIRLDSFSKCLAPGVRLSWMTAHPEVINKVLYHFHGVAMGACSLSQVTVGAMLTHMGHEGFEEHIRRLQEQYGRRAATICAAMDKHLTGLADWEPVEAGMFLWVKLRGFEDAAQILGELETAKVIVVPGRLARHSGPESKTPCPYVRLSFVTAQEDELEVAIQRLAGLLRSLQDQEKPPIPALSPSKSPSKPVAQAEAEAEVL